MYSYIMKRHKEWRPRVSQNLFILHWGLVWLVSIIMVMLVTLPPWWQTMYKIALTTDTDIEYNVTDGYSVISGIR